MTKKSIARRAGLATVLAVALAAAGAIAAKAHAATATNDMTNIVTVVDSCDLATIGVDWGFIGSTTAAAGVVSSNPNTALGVAVTSNTDHPNAAADGDGLDDLSLVTGVGVVDTVVSALLSTVVTTLPGVYAACTSSPVSLQSVTDTGDTYDFPVTTGAVLPIDTLDSELTNTDGVGTDTLDYSLAFTGVAAGAALGDVTALLPNFYIGIFTAAGTIGGNQSAEPGFYADVITTTIEF